MLISPSEPKELHALGTVSWRTEEYGADVLWVANHRTVVVQRKELGDLLSSAEDGRLGEQIAKMQAADVRALVVEGKVRAIGGTSGEMEGVISIRGGGKFARPWTMGQYRALLWSVQMRGVLVDHTESVQGTVGWLKKFEEWTRKKSHGSLLNTRGPVVKNIWGAVDDVASMRHLHLGLPGVGVEMAGRLVEQGGIIGLKQGWDEERLLGVKGLGKVGVKKILGVLGT